MFKVILTNQNISSKYIIVKYNYDFLLISCVLDMAKCF